MSEYLQRTKIPLGDAKSIGPYSFEGEIGRGRDGTIFLARARDRQASSPSTAVKVFDTIGMAQTADNEIAVHKQLSRSRRPHVLPYYSDGSAHINNRRNTKRLKFLATAYARGDTVRDIINNRGPLHPRQALELANQAANGLIGIHDQGFVHGDIKPSNLLLAEPLPWDPDVVLPELWIADFGASVPKHSQLEDITVSPGYTPPEQLCGQYLPAGDQFSLAAVFAEMVGGALLPKSKPDVYAAALFLPFYEDRLHYDIKEVIPGPFQSPLKRALSRNSNRRYKNPRTFVKALTERYNQSVEDAEKPAQTVIDLHAGGVGN